MPNRQVAKEMGITETTRYRWIHQAEDAGGREGASFEELSELRQLRKAVAASASALTASGKPVRAVGALYSLVSTHREA